MGSGRGAFIVPFSDEFPWVRVDTIDILPKRIERLGNMQKGGVANLNVTLSDICEKPFVDKSFDVVTLLEVLEHIPKVQKAIESAVSMAHQYVIVTVPSKPDNNQEHIHFLTGEILTVYFNDCGVPGSLFVIAKI